MEHCAYLLALSIVILLQTSISLSQPINNTLEEIYNKTIEQYNVKRHRHYSNDSMQLLHQLNISTLILAARDARVGESLVKSLKTRRNKTLGRWIRRRRRNKTTKVPVVNLKENEDEEYYADDYEEEYPDFDFSPASIFIYILEIFGTLLGLTWGAVSTLFLAAG